MLEAANERGREEEGGVGGFTGRSGRVVASGTTQLRPAPKM